MSQKSVVIVGAGISGLTAAYRLHQAGVPVRVLEAGLQAGGLMTTLRESDFVLEGGPHTFPSTATELLALCAALNLSPLPTAATATKRYLYLRGKLTALPRCPLEAITNPFLSLPGKLRLLLEPWQRKIQADDISIADFFKHRLGNEATYSLVDPFISGIYAGDIAALSMPAVFPKLWQWEQEAGSLLKGAMRARKNKTAPGKTSAKKEPMRLLSFEQGLASLPRALVSALPVDCIQLATRVESIQTFITETQHRPGYRLETSQGVIETQGVILATPAHVSARLLQASWPLAAQALAAIPYNEIAVAHLGLPKSSLPHPLDGFGMLIPRREHVTLLGSIWASSLFPGRAPAGQLLLSNFIGGAHHPEIANWSSEQISAQVLADFTRIFQPNVPLNPTFEKVLRYENAIPQYTLGHRERIGQVLETLAAQAPGLALCGNYLHGIALNECVKSGIQAAEALLA